MGPIDSLPDELVDKIIRLAVTRSCFDLPGHLDVYCLVCKRWSRIAQPMLFKQVMLCSLDELAKFHRSLMNSNELAECVRDITLAMILKKHPDKTLLSPDWLVADCLQQASGLEDLCVHSIANQCLTDLLLHRICLSTLRSLSIFSSLVFPEKYDSRLLLDLPTTVERLQLSFTLATSWSLLPKICQNLQLGQRTNTSHPAKLRDSSLVSRHGGHKAGLRMLHFKVDADSSYPSNNVFKFEEIGTSLADTLTTFTFRVMDLEESVWIDLLGATPLTQVLDLGDIKLSPVIFDELPCLKQLRSLKCQVYLKDTDEDGFFRSWGNFISHSSHLETVHLTLYYDTFLTSTRVIDVTVESTTINGPTSTLRNFQLVTLNPPSSESIKHLCRSAPLLEHIALPTPRSGLSEVARAMKMLKHLVSAALISRPSEVHYATRSLGGDAIDLDRLFKEIDLYHASIRTSE